MAMSAAPTVLVEDPRKINASQNHLPYLSFGLRITRHHYLKVLIFLSANNVIENLLCTLDWILNERREKCSIYKQEFPISALTFSVSSFHYLWILLFSLMSELCAYWNNVSSLLKKHLKPEVIFIFWTNIFWLCIYLPISPSIHLSIYLFLFFGLSLTYGLLQPAR